jgi:D-tyrosyl-tRNA(Tyr) deacylase
MEGNPDFCYSTFPKGRRPGEVSSMRVVLQRVKRAAVEAGGTTVAAIGEGILLYVAFRRDDEATALGWMADKVVALRIFEDQAGKMNRSVLDVGGQVLVVSQFTLYGDARKGRRPSFDGAAPAETARGLFERFIDRLGASGLAIRVGRFQEHMQVESVNNGPVTILLESPAS